MGEARRMDIEHLKSYQDPECGCPVEEWIIGGIEVMLHFEPDGKMEAFLDAGDWDHNFPIIAQTMEAARDEVAAWIYKLPVVA